MEDWGGPVQALWLHAWMHIEAILLKHTVLSVYKVVMAQASQARPPYRLRSTWPELAAWQSRLLNKCG